MGIILRQGIKGTIVAYLGVLLGAFSIVWLFPKFLEPEQFGILRWVQDTAFLLAGFSQLGVSNVVDKFFPDFKNKPKKHHGFLTFVLIYPLVGFGVLCILFFLFQDFWESLFIEKSPEVLSFFLQILPLSFFIIYNFLLEAYARAHLRIVVPTFLREVFLKIVLILLVIAYVLHWISFEQVINGVVVAYALVTVFSLIYLKGLNVLFLSKINFEILNKSIFSEILKYAFYILLGGISSLIILRIDAQMITILMGTKWVAIYTTCFFMGNIIEIPRRSLAQISTPLISQAWKDEDKNKLQSIYQSTALNLFVIACWIFLGIWLNVHSIFEILPKGEIYQAGAMVIFYIGLTRVIDMATGLNGEIILQSPSYRFNLILAVFLAGLLIITNLILIPVAGITGAAMATLLSICIWNVIKFVFLWRKYQLQPFNFQTLKVLLIATLIFFGFQWLPPFSWVWLDLFVRSVIITLIFWGLIILTKSSDDVLNFLMNIKIKLMKVLGIN